MKLAHTSQKRILALSIWSQRHIFSKVLALEKSKMYVGQAVITI